MRILTMAALRLHLLCVGAFGAMERINATPLPFAYVVLLRTFLVLSTSWRAASRFVSAASLCVRGRTTFVQRLHPHM